MCQNTYVVHCGVTALPCTTRTQSKKLTQAQLAAFTGVSRVTISQLENGQSTIYLRRLLAVARAMDIEFFTGVDTHEHTER
jgi:transcriptional regulator with XRE-family HTH domain